MACHRTQVQPGKCVIERRHYTHCQERKIHSTSPMKNNSVHLSMHSSKITGLMCLVDTYHFQSAKARRSCVVVARYSLLPPSCWQISSSRKLAPQERVWRSHPEGAEEVDGLSGEGVHEVLHVSAVDAVVLEDAHAHSHAVVAAGRPVELLHASITDQRRVQSREIVSCADDGHTRDLLLLRSTICPIQFQSAAMLLSYCTSTSPPLCITASVLFTSAATLSIKANPFLSLLTRSARHNKIVCNVQVEHIYDGNMRGKTGQR